ncbi:hypothetical protein [Burkholderia stabilis]|uniref:Uncharacterized protein n=1 Tax=Burkholderia stabilis TaxID=95485 RepID=A0AAJ5T8J9_9BURK|nr:hypothetical protein [Burkholderia stabilis]VBB16473.1 hypothetical protein BSTAB16_6678 [Burkholderia stabilis]
MGQLIVGDEGPDMNIKVYSGLLGLPVQGGYLDTTTGINWRLPVPLLKLAKSGKASNAAQESLLACF